MAKIGIAFIAGMVFGLALLVVYDRMKGPPTLSTNAIAALRSRLYTMDSNEDEPIIITGGSFDAAPAGRYYFDPLPDFEPTWRHDDVDYHATQGYVFKVDFTDYQGNTTPYAIPDRTKPTTITLDYSKRKDHGNPDAETVCFQTGYNGRGLTVTSVKGSTDCTKGSRDQFSSNGDLKHKNKNKVIDDVQVLNNEMTKDFGPCQNPDDNRKCTVTIHYCGSLNGCN